MMYAQPDPTWKHQYVMTGPRPTDPTRPFFGLPAVGAGAGAIAPVVTRTARMRTQRPHVTTEAYGTSPYLGRGDGVMLNVGVSSRLREGIPVLRGDRKVYGGGPPSRMHFVNAPLAVQKVAAQLGQDTRLEPVYE